MDDIHPIRRWRKERGVTLATLGGVVGSTPSHISEIERGLDKPSLGLAGKLSQATADESGTPAVSVEQIAEAARVAQ